jgi:hypothetical protein
LLVPRRDRVRAIAEESRDPAASRERKKKGGIMTGEWDFILVAIAALAAGVVNAIAGGGTLITFPMLTAVGVPVVAANVTSTVALCPGYLGATWAQSKELRGQKRLLWLLLPAGVVGGIAGGALLLNTEERMFRSLAPFLILAASALLALQDPLRAWISRRAGVARPAVLGGVLVAVPIALAAIYGGYFGAGLSIIVLSVLGLTLDDSLTRLNAVKQVISFSVNTAAAVFFVFSGEVVWRAALVMALAALAGGALGGKLAGRIQPSTLRWCVVAIGTVVGVTYLVR